MNWRASYLLITHPEHVCQGWCLRSRQICLLSTTLLSILNKLGMLFHAQIVTARRKYTSNVSPRPLAVSLPVDSTRWLHRYTAGAARCNRHSNPYHSAYSVAAPRRAVQPIRLPPSSRWLKLFDVAMAIPYCRPDRLTSASYLCRSPWARACSVKAYL